MYTQKANAANVALETLEAIFDRVHAALEDVLTPGQAADIRDEWDRLVPAMNAVSEAVNTALAEAEDEMETAREEATDEVEEWKDAATEYAAILAAVEAAGVDLYALPAGSGTVGGYLDDTMTARMREVWPVGLPARLTSCAV